MNLVLFGPPGVGKSSVGRLVAQHLRREFIDVDDWIAARWGRPVEGYFAAGEEALFRQREVAACRALAASDGRVIAAGGGALREPHARAALEGTGVVVCLMAEPATLLERLADGPVRPLLSGDPAGRLERLLAERASLYASFAERLATDGRPAEAVAAAVAERFARASGRVRFAVQGAPALLGPGLLADLPELLEAQGLRPPFVLITDSNVRPLYGQAAASALDAPVVAFAAGEQHKTLDTVRQLYSACLEHGLERGGTVLALGGGVVGDVAGFVAATFMRGVAWVNLPTTLLAMADASLGGKVGVDLPEGKNLVGAFHPPALIAADTSTLASLPTAETRGGMAEVIKSAVIGDEDLFARLASGSMGPAAAVARAAAVKVGVVNADPRERGERAVLNLGHTIGHGLEAASGYRLRHGEAVAIGLAAEARLAEAAGLAEAGLAASVEACLERHGLPVRASGLPIDAVRAAMARDKKSASGRLRFALPRRVAEVAWGVEVDEALVARTLEAVINDP